MLVRRLDVYHYLPGWSWNANGVCHPSWTQIEEATQLLQVSTNSGQGCNVLSMREKKAKDWSASETEKYGTLIGSMTR